MMPRKERSPSPVRKGRRDLVDDLRRVRTHGRSPLHDAHSLFLEMDRPALRPLPSERFDLSAWSHATVNIDYHIHFDHSFYSVPYTLVCKTVNTL